jgi:hypothetical protein
VSGITSTRGGVGGSITTDAMSAWLWKLVRTAAREAEDVRRGRSGSGPPAPFEPRPNALLVGVVHTAADMREIGGGE